MEAAVLQQTHELGNCGVPVTPIGQTQVLPPIVQKYHKIELIDNVKQRERLALTLLRGD